MGGGGTTGGLTGPTAERCVCVANQTNKGSPKTELRAAPAPNDIAPAFNVTLVALTVTAAEEFISTAPSLMVTKSAPVLAEITTFSLAVINAPPTVVTVNSPVLAFRNMYVPSCATHLIEPSLSITICAPDL